MDGKWNLWIGNCHSASVNDSAVNGKNKFFNKRCKILFQVYECTSAAPNQFKTSNLRYPGILIKVKAYFQKLNPEMTYFQIP